MKRLLLMIVDIFETLFLILIIGLTILFTLFSVLDKKIFSLNSLKFIPKDINKQNFIVKKIESKNGFNIQVKRIIFGLIVYSEYVSNNKTNGVFLPQSFKSIEDANKTIENLKKEIESS